MYDVCMPRLVAKEGNRSGEDFCQLDRKDGELVFPDELGVGETVQALLVAAARNSGLLPKLILLKISFQKSLGERQ